jgi:hypothetical protein
LDKLADAVGSSDPQENLFAANHVVLSVYG